MDEQVNKDSRTSSKYWNRLVVFRQVLFSEYEKSSENVFWVFLIPCKHTIYSKKSMREHVYSKLKLIALTKNENYRCYTRFKQYATNVWKVWFFWYFFVKVFSFWRWRRSFLLASWGFLRISRSQRCTCNVCYEN